MLGEIVTFEYDKRSNFQTNFEIYIRKVLQERKNFNEDQDLDIPELYEEFKRVYGQYDCV
tara:strand:+ start:254 stop:433 length:180 start_codon:yes stop_codon:yes gene_type:complete